MVFHAAVQMQPAPGFKKLLQVLRVKLGIIGGTMYFGTLIAMQSMLRNKNYGPKAHENWQVTFISLLSRAYCKHSKSDVRIYVEDNSIVIPPSLPDLHLLLEWKRRLGAFCLTAHSTILQESRAASQHLAVRHTQCTGTPWNLFSPRSVRLAKLPPEYL